MSAAEEYAHLGRGWAFPPRWALDEDAAADGEAAAVLATSAGIGHVQEAMRVLLRTGVAARLMRPQLGVGVDRYVFEPRTADVCYRLANDVRRALLRWEPRVLVDAVTAVPAGEADERIDVRIDYRVDRHSRPANLVLPFALQEPS